MGKTRTEIQKAYRERSKAKNNEQYLAKERKRRKESYTSTFHLPSCLDEIAYAET